MSTNPFNLQCECLDGPDIKSGKDCPACVSCRKCGAFLGCTNSMGLARLDAKMLHEGFIYHKGKWKCPVCCKYSKHKEGCKMDDKDRQVHGLINSSAVGNKVDIEKLLDSLPTCKDTNPKDAVGIKKVPISTVPHGVLMELGLAMLEGSRKYGRHNYREVGTRASVYRDAVWRHLTAWWDFGQDDDPDSGLNHIVKAIASLVVLYDSVQMGNWVDDRPPPLPLKLLEEFNKKAADIVERHPNAKEPFINKVDK